MYKLPEWKSQEKFNLIWLFFWKILHNSFGDFFLQVDFCQYSFNSGNWNLNENNIIGYFMKKSRWKYILERIMKIFDFRRQKLKPELKKAS